VKINSLPAWLVLFLFVAGCNSMKVTCEQEQSFDFASVRSYQWINAPEKILKETDTYLMEDIRSALDRELAARGLRAEPQNPDIQITCYVKLREETKYTDLTEPGQPGFSGGFVYDRESRDWNYSERTPDLNSYTVEIGTLTVLVYETGKGTIVWHGTLQTEMDRSLPKEKRTEQTNTMAEKLISALPIPAK